ncbi:MAG TPA: hypothetical protein VGP36_12210 [Mycobacteriales bacterium]|jgi:hypothetical protein|nr:hypothetical protein [Mycobacteriales bacterium]
MEQQDGAGGVATAAKDQAAQVGGTAAQAGGQVARTTKDQAANVVGEATQQARDLLGEARTQVGDQVGAQKGRAVGGLRSLGDELRQLADEGNGLGGEVARQASTRAHGLADHLDRHEPGELVDQVRTYARRHPVAFLTGAAVLGVLAGRLTRNLASDDSGPQELTGGSPSLAISGSPVDYAGPAANPPQGANGASGEFSSGYAPVYEQPISGQPIFDESVDEQPLYDQPLSEEPVHRQPGYAPAGGIRAAGEPEPAFRPASGYESSTEDPAWRNP